MTLAGIREVVSESTDRKREFQLSGARLTSTVLSVAAKINGNLRTEPRARFDRHGHGDHRATKIVYSLLTRRQTPTAVNGPMAVGDSRERHSRERGDRGHGRRRRPRYTG